MNNRTKKFTPKKLTTMGMLCALAYAAVSFGRIPLILFLKYDPKDVIIAIGGLIYGPFVSFGISLIVSAVEMLTISGTGVWGMVMNVISSCAFTCPAAFIYQRRRSLLGAVIGLLGGWATMVLVMMLWNYLIVPIYMGYPREAVLPLLASAFLPFNLIKGGINTVLIMLLYKPVVTALRRASLVDR